MTSIFLFVVLVLAIIQVSKSFSITRFSARKGELRRISAIFAAEDAVPNAPKADAVRDNEMKQVDKGLTHIKYNKYAPSAEEAAGMTDEQFRGTIMRRMREAENERRKAGPVGSAVSDDYINSLGRKPAPTEE